MNKRAGVLVCVCAGLGACALSDAPAHRSKTGARAPRVVAPAREVKPVEGAEPVQIFLSRGTVTDSDADGYPDTIPAIVYLFPNPEVSDLPVWADGEFEFRLLDATHQLVARWVFPNDVTATSRKQLPPGPAYSFFLRLGGEDDRMEPQTLELSAVFRSVSGRMVTSNGSAAVQLGAR
ncbi:MAG: hypothetical protein R3B49_03860 [Phycisphaerales bacterium]